MVMLFGAKKDQFPPIMAIGDVIYIYRLQIQTHSQELQGVAIRGKDSTMFATFSGGEGESTTPRPQGSVPLAPPHKYSLKWLSRTRKQAGELLGRALDFDRRYLIHLNAITFREEFLDLVGRIEAIRVVAPGTYHLWLWDGTQLQMHPE